MQAPDGASRMRQERDDELSCWLRLEQTPGVGPETARKLLAAFGLPAHIFATDFASLRLVVSERIAQALCAPPSPAMLAQIDATHAWLALPGNHVLTLADDAYPRALLEIADPPLLLYLKGRLDLLSCPALAVVGSRNATAQGMANAENFSAMLSQAGLTIVSGMALGIDTAAHKGGLRGVGASIAVIGTGADIVYPARNRSLAHQLAEGGCIVSEYALGMPAIAANFPRRNRIISGLSRGVLVIEAADRSGSLITARMAAEQGRDVFAIPGSIHSPLSKGCHLLIKQGAKLVESAQDILEDFPLHQSSGQAAAPPAETLHPISPPATDADQKLLDALGHDPVDGDTLAARCALDAASLNARLFTLELAGMVERLPGGSYRRLHS